MKIYKLTNQEMQTYNGFQWKLNVAAPELLLAGGELCSDKFYHAYTHPLLAVFLNPIHTKIAKPRLFVGEGFGESIDDYGLKVGFKSMVLSEEMAVPEVTLVNRVAFGILCVLEVTEDEGFKTWAENWLNGVDRTVKSTESTESAAWAARAAREAESAAELTAWVAESAARAAELTARAAESAVARAAEWAARAAEYKQIEFISLAEKSLTIQ